MLSPAAVLLSAALVAAPAASRPPVVRPPAPVTSIGYLTAGELADRCQRGVAADTNYCFAFIAGVHDTIQAYEKWLSTREFCAPTSLAHADLRRLFLTYVTAYPSTRGGVAASVIVVALKQTYPC